MHVNAVNCRWFLHSLCQSRFGREVEQAADSVMCMK